MPTKIVIADDQPDYRALLRMLLGRLPDTTVVGEAGDGSQAVELVLRERPDLVIVDMVMPRLNGIELTRRIKEALPETKVILVSAYTGEAYRRVADVSGADGFVYKQVMHSHLLPLVEQLIAGPSPA